MSNLAYLHLQNDRFIGVLPSAMFNLPVLKIMDISGDYLSGDIPDYFPLYPHLAILILARNRFHGIIPVSLCQMQKFHILVISANLLSGVLPKIPLTAKGNALSYEGIPLSQITILDLSMNKLYTLNLSYNHLIGKIPPQMTQLDSLSTLNLAFNHLSGRIPLENKIFTFAAASYRGNKELCGPPVENDCVFSIPPQQQEEEDAKQGIRESDFFFYSCTAVAYVGGFWSVIAPLLLSRNTYYAKVDRCIELCKEKLHLF
ncbi:unnamed protein product [Withania somnifera]